MIKKILIIFTLIFIFATQANADIMPYYLSSINPNSIGVYQASSNIKIHKEPNENSNLLLNINWDTNDFNCSEVSAGNLFVAFLPKRNLAFLTVVDENENGDWLEVSYNKNGLKTGWIKKEDQYRFMVWRTFLNLYGRKYGLYYLKDAPECSKIIYGSTSENAKSIGKITIPQTLKLNKTSGNWILITAFDIDKMPKIGWLNWRSLSGEIYLFPKIK